MALPTMPTVLDPGDLDTGHTGHRPRIKMLIHPWDGPALLQTRQDTGRAQLHVRPLRNTENTPEIPNLMPHLLPLGKESITA